MDYVNLKIELTTDPLSRGYAGMTDQQAADSLKMVNRAVDVDSISTSEIFEAIALAEFNALTAVQKTLLQIVLSLGTVKIKGTNTRTALLSLFGPGTATRPNLAALQTRLISRVEELRLPPVGLHHVAYARNH